MSQLLRASALARTIFILLTLGAIPCLAADGHLSDPATSLPTSIDDQCRTRFLKEAPPAWKQLRERLRGFELELTYVDHRPDEDAGSIKDSSTSTYSILNDGVSRRLDRGKSIDVTNSRYSFKVKASEPANIYSLAEIDLWQQGAPQPMAGWLDIAEMNVAMTSNIWWMPIETMLANNDFKIAGVDCGQDKTGNEVVRIVYRYTGKASDFDLNLQPDGVYWAELIPARFWIVMRSGLTSSMTKYSLEEMPFKAQVTTSYQEWNGVPLPALVRIESVNLQRNVVVRLQENRFGPPRACTRPLEEFYLPFYGLSEKCIPPVEDRLFSSRFWIVAAGVVCMIFAWLAYKRSKSVV